VSNPKFELLSNEDGSVVTGVTRSPTARPTYHADATLACKDASKIEFSTYYHTENGHFHVPLDTQSKGVDFSVSGPDGVNIAMLPEGVGLDDLTQGYTAGYEIYLGAEEEPFVHISNKFGDTPDAVAHLTGQQDIPNAFDAKRDFSIIVDGTSVTVYQGHSHKEDKVALVSFDSGVDKTITNAIFSYGYGDLECGVASESLAHAHTYHLLKYFLLSLTFVKYKYIIVDFCSICKRYSSLQYDCNSSVVTSIAGSKGFTQHRGQILLLFG
jgi:hypothetical protein